MPHSLDANSSNQCSALIMLDCHIALFACSRLSVTGFCSVSSAPVLFTCYCCPCCYYRCQMSCPSVTGCVQPDQLCNGKQDCADGSDESADFCSSFNCSSKGEVGAVEARRLVCDMTGVLASLLCQACIAPADGCGGMPGAR